MKITLFLILIYVITKSTMARELHFGITEGSYVTKATLLYYKHFMDKAHAEGISDEFWWPNSDDIIRYFKITKLQILDYNKQNANITKISGGVGNRWVNYKFDSPLNQGLDIEVMVWGVFIDPCSK